jgi:hypothetical protein
MRRRNLLVSLVLLFPILGVRPSVAAGAPVGPGYDDTPMLPGRPWRVHDNTRPHPPVVAPGTASTQDLPGRPPSDAVVLFDGTSLDAWVKAGTDQPSEWRLENGYMEATHTGSLQSREHFGDCQIHLEWAAPLPVKGTSQDRGNSGVLIMGRYEVQILDSYENATYADGQAAAIYGQFPPEVNACRPPGQWQTYDIVFIAPRFDGDRLESPARLTVFHNGVLVHHDRELIGQAAHKAVAVYHPHPPMAPIVLQDHLNPVRFRNIWVRPLPVVREP